MKSKISLRECLSDPQLLAHVMVGDTWKPQRILSIAAMGETLTEDERIVFKKFTGRDHEPCYPVREFHTIGGRRTGKTITKAMNATYLAACCDYSDVLARGETGVCLCLAQDQRVATQLLDFVEENLKGSPILRQLIVSRTSDSLELKSNIRIEVRPASFRKLRGPTYCAILADELAFWFVDEGYANPDTEVLAAARPGLMTTHGMLLTASSPYAQRGVLWEAFKKHYGPNGDPLVLVAKGTTNEFNPTITQAEIDAELERDPIKNRAEYLAEFRADIQSLFILEAIMNCVSPGVFERHRKHHETYQGFVDPSGGSSDSMAIAIGHKDISSKVMITDAIREARPPFSPEAVCAEFASLCKSYGISKITGDRYAGEWPKELFGKFGIRYEQSARPKSELYLDLLAAINSRGVSLLDNGRLISQMVGLERRVARSGKDSIDHAPGGHDDVVNCVAGLCAETLSKFPGYDTSYRAFQPDFVDEDRRDAQPAAAQPAPITNRSFAGRWWESQPKPTAVIPSADDVLRQGLKSLDIAIKAGGSF